jgi:hypothetical protein
MRAWLAKRRSLDNFDIVAEGKTPPDNKAAAAESVKAWQDAGATWWLEADWESFDPATTRRRIEAGPPRG